jgi:lipid-A-disaccharide synthase
MGMNATKNFAMVAGETSGDMLAALLLQACQQRWPGLRAHGIGGSRMVQAGFEATWPSDKLAVRGYVEVLRHYREIVGIRSQLREQLLSNKPDLFIGVDAPDFNLELETALKAAGVPTVHFVSPSIWAWRAERIHKIAQAVDHVLCIFPFEPALYARLGIAATYVGHPLAPHIPMQPDMAAARSKLGLDQNAHVIAILPGSRVSEITHIAPRFFEAAQHIALRMRDEHKAQRKHLQFVVPVVPHVKVAVEQALQNANLSHEVRQSIQLVDGQSHTVLAACDLTLIASGTATLEAALFKKPMVIGYAMPLISWWIMRRKKLQPWVGLPNILCGEFVVPELLQDDCTPAKLAQEACGWLTQPERVKTLQERFTALHQELTRDTGLLATQAIAQVLGEAA